MAAGFLQTNMVSDIPGLANHTDPHLINPFGLTPTGTFWVADNNSGFSTLYDGIGTPQGLVVTIPAITGSKPGTLGQPSGVVFNSFAKQGAFDIAAKEPAIFLFDSQDGVISAWSFLLANPTKAVAKVDNPAANYSGLAIGSDANGDPLLYAANFGQGTIDVFDTNFKSVDPAQGIAAPNGVSSVHLLGDFRDSALPSGFSPFNIQNIGGLFYVEYAQVDPKTVEGKIGGPGFVDVYNGDGQLLKRLIKGADAANLSSPWGVAMAPAGFGPFSGDLLVGNFGNGWINAYDPNTGHFIGTVTDQAGNPFVEDHLWAINPGTGTNGQLKNAIYFTAGIGNEAHGLFGSLQFVPDLSEKAPLLPSLNNGAKQTFTTVGANGDQNPYGVAFVPSDFKGQGTLQAGDLLVSDFNNAGTKTNQGGTQGTGSTIMRITPDGGTSVFFQGKSQLGLTTALGVLKNGFVLVGSVPTPDGTAANIQAGSILVLDSSGKLVETIDGNLLDSPWDLTINDQGNTAQVFVSNVVSGTVTRIDLKVPAPGKGGKPMIESETMIGSGFTSKSDKAAVILGPTGLVYDAKTDTLYVASTADNAIFAINDAAGRTDDAGMGKNVFSDAHLRGPLGMAVAPNGDLIVANGDAKNADKTGKHNSELIEFTPGGKFMGAFQVDPTLGSAFGVAFTEDKNGDLRFAAVDDTTNSVSVWTFNGVEPGAAHLSRHSAHHHGHKG
jgi:uncharacterized protein (TIGR03118 family)